MQFLSDVEVTCPECGGTRFRPEVREVRVDGPLDRRRPRPDGGRGARALRGTAARVARPLAAARRGRPRLPAPRASRSPRSPAASAQRLRLAAALAEGPAPRDASTSSTSPPRGCTSRTSAVLLRALRRLADARPRGARRRAPPRRDARRRSRRRSRPRGRGRRAAASSRTGRPRRWRAATGHTARYLREALARPRAARRAPRKRRVRRARRHRRCAARASTTSRTSTWTCRATRSWSSAGRAAPASRRWPSTSCSPRGSAATSRRSRPTRASSSGSSRGRTWTTSPASRRPWPSSSAARAAAGARPWPPSRRSRTSCACSSRAPAMPHCPVCDRELRALPPETLHDRILEEHRGEERAACFAPVVLGRKGFHRTCSSAWRSRATAGARRRRASCALEPPPALDRYREHDVEVEIARLTVGRGRAAARCAHGDRRQPSRSATATWCCSAPTDGSARLLSVQRTCPRDGTTVPELDPRFFSHNSRRGWCPTCRGLGTRAAASRPRCCPSTRISR